MSVAVVIPTYNHGGRLTEVLAGVQELNLPVFVVDDGSTDHTGQVLAAFPAIHVLRHPVNRGKGAALITGFTAAAKSCDWALTLDADGQHRPGDAWPFIRLAGEGERVLCVGNRQGMTGKNVPWTSRFGRQFSNFWVWASGGPWLGDSQSGFRLYPLPECLHLGVVSRRYQFEVEILVRASRQGITVCELPVSVVYQPPGERVSHFRPWKDFCRNSAIFSRLLWSRLCDILRLR
ncbi:MAG: glycosyltransferase family 2 protein [Desulfopila sp.]